ncbi:ice-binding family protein [Litoribacter populi]|uniref:ice-binding family protein n=1 Tax=Litoribacter populi TaxID=2598460 RepID=UPI00163D7641|nr:ice-binding family protein [Litoribacter populi]
MPNVIFGQTTAPNLGTASSFGVFTGAGAITNDGNTVVNGDLGTFAGAITGFPPGIVTGTIYPVGDPYLNGVRADVEAAYTDLSNRTCGTVLTTPLGNGQILTPGVYCIGSAATLEGGLILDAQGDPNAIFIIQIGGAFSTSANSTITLINGACLSNVYWQIGGAVELGANSVFRGTIVADGQIELLEGSTLYGRALAISGAILLNNNDIIVPADQAEAPIVALVQPTCEEPGSATITNYDPAYTYVFSPAGPVVDASGVITGFTPGVTYTVTANNTDECASAASAEFTIEEAEEAPA